MFLMSTKKQISKHVKEFIKIINIVLEKIKNIQKIFIASIENLCDITFKIQMIIIYIKIKINFK